MIDLVLENSELNQLHNSVNCFVWKYIPTNFQNTIITASRLQYNQHPKTYQAFSFHLFLKYFILYLFVVSQCH